MYRNESSVRYCHSKPKMATNVHAVTLMGCHGWPTGAMVSQVAADAGLVLGHHPSRENTKRHYKVGVCTCPCLPVCIHACTSIMMIHVHTYMSMYVCM